MNGERGDRWKTFRGPKAEFWLPDKADDDVAGTVEFSGTSGLLRLIGAFGGGTPMAGFEADGPIRIVGVAGKKLLTLDGCFQTAYTTNFPGGPAQEFFVARVFSDVAFDADEPLEFVGMQITIEGLDHWLGRTGLAMEFQGPENKPFNTARINYEEVADEQHHLGDGQKLSVHYNWSFSTDRLTRASVSQQGALRLTREEAAPLDEFWVPRLFAVQDLLTIAYDAAVTVTNVALFHKEHVREVPEGDPVQLPIGLYAADRAFDVAGARAPLTSPRFLFTFDDIGRLGGVTRWLDVAVRRQAPLNQLLAARYGYRLYEENRYLNTITAAEGLHRDTFPNYVMAPADFKKWKHGVLDQVGDKQDRKRLNELFAFANEPRLAARLADLADSVVPELSALVPDVGRWSSVTAKVRNLAVHQASPESRADGVMLHAMGEAAFYVVAGSLLLELDPQRNVLAKLATSRSLNHAAQLLPTELDRAEEVLKKSRKTRGNRKAAKGS